MKEVGHEGKRYTVYLNPEQAEQDRAAGEVVLSDLEEKLKKAPPPSSATRATAATSSWEGSRR